MKKVKLREESYEKLKKTLMESTYGNDDLSSFYYDLDLAFKDFYSVIREHYIMLDRMGQTPDENVGKIKNYADAINTILESMESI
jgi:hypothetical protein